MVCEDAPFGDLVTYVGSGKAQRGQLWRILHETALALDYLYTNSSRFVAHNLHVRLHLKHILVGSGGAARIGDVLAPTPSEPLSAQSPRSPRSLKMCTSPSLGQVPTARPDVYMLGKCILHALSTEVADEDATESNGKLQQHTRDLENEAWRLGHSMAHGVASERPLLSDVIAKLQEFRDRRAIASVVFSERSPLSDPASALTEVSECGVMQNEPLFNLFRTAIAESTTGTFALPSVDAQLRQLMKAAASTWPQKLCAISLLYQFSSRTHLNAVIKSVTCVQPPASASLAELTAIITDVTSDEAHVANALDLVACLIVHWEATGSEVDDDMVALIVKHMQQAASTLLFIAASKILCALATVSCAVACALRATTPFLVDMLRALHNWNCSSEPERDLAVVATLATIVMNYNGLIAILEAGGLKCLPDLLCGSTEAQRVQAVRLCCHLACHDWCRSSLIEVGVVFPLAAVLFRVPSDQREQITAALEAMATEYSVRVQLQKSDALRRAIDVVRTGSRPQMDQAFQLCKIVNEDASGQRVLIELGLVDVLLRRLLNEPIEENEDVMGFLAFF